MLRAGLPVRDKLIERNDGRKFVTTLQVNVEIGRASCRERV